MSRLLQLRGNDKGKSRKSSTAEKKKPKFSYRLIDFKNSLYSTDHLIGNTKCNLDIYEAGLLINGDFSETYTAISLLSNELESITLIRGKETINTFYLSPMHILTKLGVSSHISRHFRFHPTEYKISETRIIIKAREHHMELITSGYRFERLEQSLKNKGYGLILKVIRKPSHNYIEYGSNITLTKRPFLE